ncbi:MULTISPECIES: hypothetical protein [unclassified Paenibacillus]|uniref:hypothetical protein n=1 Tax=unclassified Paenibacillus TaxID=185978 RepID=UPI00020D6711|nr:MULTISPECIES: hypothetical protein [unclassified Paenibacillus]EGL16114.1 hypothetical protein HMPREF9413_0144 [Paenibacillus sp. HGF7]EPD80825.1 hypothetical protein HMPREF1207_04582 [Paenibacillus sp. HGH0039]
MRKIRLLPVLLSVVITAFFLFGGWFAYQTYAIGKPLGNIVKETPGVDQSQVTYNDKEVSIRLSLKPDTSLREVYGRITKEGASTIGSRDVKLSVNTKESPDLDKWWAQALFDVAQAMETRHYADIPTALEKHKTDKDSNLVVKTEMDEQNVYVHLQKGDQHKYVVLPRNAEKVGVFK